MSTDPNFSSYGSEQQWLASLVVNGVSYGNFDKFSGGDASAAVTKYRPAGMGDERTYLALPVYSDVMLSKAFVQADLALQTALRAAAGSGQATVTLTPLTDQKLAWGNNRVYTGRLSKVNDGNTDSTSGAIRTWSVDIVVETITG
jgi:hypothetical protein